MTFGVRAKRSLGQNFLVDGNIQRKIVDALHPDPQDTILEIGPGTGALTRRLAGTVRRLVAVELDDRLAAALAVELASVPGLEVVHADVLDLDLAHIMAGSPGYRVVGNIPYNITTPLLFRLLEPEIRPLSILLMVQKEVAERLTALPGAKQYGALSVGVRSVARVELLFPVGRQAFRPVPRVDSAVVRVTPLDPPPLDPAEEEDLRSLTRTLFSWRRKQLQRTLRSAPHYGLNPKDVEALAEATGLDFSLRPESLDPAALIRLSQELRRRGLPPRKHNGRAP